VGDFEIVPISSLSCSWQASHNPSSAIAGSEHILPACSGCAKLMHRQMAMTVPTVAARARAYEKFLSAHATVSESGKLRRQPHEDTVVRHRDE
jgi:hypothetical protein